MGMTMATIQNTYPYQVRMYAVPKDSLTDWNDHAQFVQTAEDMGNVATVYMFATHQDQFSDWQGMVIRPYVINTVDETEPPVLLTEETRFMLCKRTEDMEDIPF